MERLHLERLNLVPNLPIYIVALITWLGVLLYLFRLEKITRDLERQVDSATHRDEK